VTVRLATQRLKQLRTLRTTIHCYSFQRFGHARCLHLQGPKMRQTPSTLKKDAIVPPKVYRNLKAAVSATTLIFVNADVGTFILTFPFRRAISVPQLRVLNCVNLISAGSAPTKFAVINYNSFVYSAQETQHKHTA